MPIRARVQVAPSSVRYHKLPPPVFHSAAAAAAYLLPHFPLAVVVTACHLRGLPFRRRLYAFTDASGKTKPGMVALPPSSGGGGAAVHLEVWEMPLESFGAFMLQVRLRLTFVFAWASGTESCARPWAPQHRCTCCIVRLLTPVQVPPPLGIGTVKLDDGSSVKGFICEGWVAGALQRLCAEGCLARAAAGGARLPCRCPICC